jgi:hypothetical protein
MKFNLKTLALYVIIAVLLYFAIMGVPRSSGFISSPRSLTLSNAYPIESEPDATNPMAGVKSIFDLPCKPECVPGAGESGSYYTKDLTPCGICGAQEFVKSQSNYNISGGIGGSLLDN